MKEDVIVLGSGKSILSLSQREVEYINECEVKISLNKFMAFYAKSRILPSHVFYVDCYESSVRQFLDFIVNKCIKDKIEDLNFVFGRDYEGGFDEEKFEELCYNVDFITHQMWNNPNNTWAESLEEPLFHYRGSLSTALNYVAIKYPGRTIKLVGVDLDSPDHFFEEELISLGLEHRDWTYEIARNQNLHFSALNYMGSTIFDKFDYMISCLSSTGNQIYNCNPNSLLSKRTNLTFREILANER